MAISGGGTSCSEKTITRSLRVVVCALRSQTGSKNENSAADKKRSTDVEAPLSQQLRSLPTAIRRRTALTSARVTVARRVSVGAVSVARFRERRTDACCRQQRDQARYPNPFHRSLHHVSVWRTLRCLRPFQGRLAILFHVGSGAAARKRSLPSSWRCCSRCSKPSDFPIGLARTGPLSRTPLGRAKMRFRSVAYRIVACEKWSYRAGIARSEMLERVQNIGD